MVPQSTVLLLIIAFNSELLAVDGEKRHAPPKTTAQQAMARSSYLVAGLCAQDDCCPQNQKDGIMSCLSAQFMDAWESCVRDTEYTTCIPTMAYYTYFCLMVKIIDNPDIIHDDDKDCVEDHITIRSYRCSVKQFFELRYNQSMFSDDQKKKFEMYKLKAKRTQAGTS